ncbi:hypothetical protein FlaCF_3102 [Flavobacterium tructae]
MLQEACQEKETAGIMQSESFFKTLKVELIYLNYFRNKYEAELTISECIENFTIAIEGTNTQIT